MGLAEKRNYYETLGISKNATAEDIKSAYKRLAKKYHPDVSSEPKAKEKFQEALEAYTILHDSQKRQNYDQFGHAAEGFSGYQDFSGFGGRGVDFDFSDLFENISDFGGFGPFADLFGNRKKRDSHGENLRADISIPFEEAVFGITKAIEIERVEDCSECHGSGADKGDHGQKTCPRCAGKGITQKTQQTPFGLFSTQNTCSQCGGEGKIIERPCKTCKGKGKVRKTRKIKIKIPAGIETGMHLQLQGEGNAGRGKGQKGDLFVVVFVEKHRFFKRDGSDILFETPLSFSEAALGSKLEVPTLKGKAILNIPGGTQTDTIFRMKGKGVKDLNSGRVGDQFVKVNVITPNKLSRKERELFEELNKQNGLKEKRKSVFDFLK